MKSSTAQALGPFENGEATHIGASRIQKEASGSPCGEPFFTKEVDHVITRDEERKHANALHTVFWRAGTAIDSGFAESVPRGQTMLKGHLSRVMYHQVY